MDDSLEGLLPSPPAGYRWHDTLAFGFAIAVPRRFHLLTNTFDPIARDLRHIVDDEDEPRGPDGEALWADGIWDPEVIDELPDRRVQPTRIFEFDVVGPRPEPMPPDMQREMWFQSRQMLPSILESGGLPGYRLLDISMLRLGELDALGFEYRLGRAVPRGERRRPRPARLGPDEPARVPRLPPLRRGRMDGAQARARRDPRDVPAHQWGRWRRPGPVTQSA